VSHETLVQVGWIFSARPLCFTSIVFSVQTPTTCPLTPCHSHFAGFLHVDNGEVQSCREAALGFSGLLPGISTLHKPSLAVWTRRVEAGCPPFFTHPRDNLLQIVKIRRKQMAPVNQDVGDRGIAQPRSNRAERNLQQFFIELGLLITGGEYHARSKGISTE
jgi:hypothetical protein